MWRTEMKNKTFTAGMQNHPGGTKQKAKGKSTFHYSLFTIHFSLTRLCISALKILLVFSVISAQTGVLIPSSLSDKPDPKVLSLAVMNIDITIDNQHATVRVMQIFDNHTARTLEGKYLFALPPASSVADFAVWDNDLRIPGVMMEKRRANRIYEQIKQKEIDPGLLQQEDEHGGNSAFSAKIFPINALWNKAAGDGIYRNSAG
jgi:hypothetical protein